jgi:hypothetical protein
MPELIEIHSRLMKDSRLAEEELLEVGSIALPPSEEEGLGAIN